MVLLLDIFYDSFYYLLRWQRHNIVLHSVEKNLASERVGVWRQDFDLDGYGSAAGAI